MKSNSQYLEQALTGLTADERDWLVHFLVGAASVEIKPDTWRRMVDDTKRITARSKAVPA